MSLPRRIGVFQLQHRVGHPRARQRFQAQARQEAPLRYRQAVRAKIKVRHQGDVGGKELGHGAARGRFCISPSHIFAQVPTSINHNEIMNRFHLEGHGVAPHLPLTATETQANTQDPGALRLPRLPFHPIALRLTRATNAHPLHPAALAFVSYGIVLVQVQDMNPITF